jgi:lipoyl-dependent peroxiredoxin
MTLEKILYAAKAHTTGGREGGASRTDDGRLDVKISLPGGPGAGTNPEQLFAAGWSMVEPVTSKQRGEWR